MLDYLTEVGTVDMADKPEMQDVRRMVLEAALSYYQQFIDQHRDDPSIEKELAESHLRVAGILNEIGSQPEALAALQRGIPSISPKISSRRGHIQGFLLTQKSVQDELKLTKEQRQVIEQASETRREAFRGFRHRRPEEWNQMLKEQTARDKAILAMLAPEQTSRLGQIVLQQRGVRGLVESDLAETLGLSEEQKQRIRALLEQAGDRRSGPRDGKWTEETNPALKEQVLAVLSDEQQAKWQSMMGAAFTGEIRHGPPGGRGQPPKADRRRHP